LLKKAVMRSSASSIRAVLSDPKQSRNRPSPAADLPFDQIKARWENNFSHMADNAFVYLMQGTTSIRQTSGPWRRLLPMKRRIDAGEVPGPRVMLGGALFMSAQYFDFYTRSSQSPAETIPWLRNEFAYNVIADLERDTKDFESSDFAFWKIYMSDEVYDGKNDFSDEQIRWLIDRGHKLGKKIDCHTGPHNAGMRRMTAFDIDTLEHPFLGNTIVEPDIIAAYARKHVIAASLLTVMVAQAERMSDPHRFDEATYFMSMRPDEYRLLMQYRDKMMFNRAHPAQGGLPIYQGNVKPGESVRDTFGLKGPSYDELMKRRETARANMRAFIAAGVKMSLGMDTPTFLNFPQEDPTVAEFRAMTELGLTPMEAVQAATRNGAEALGMLDRLGTIERGKLADVIVLAGDPLQDPAAFKRVAVVVKDGIRYK
jgi:imidazolonepropionase-like amidohydrolase